MTAPCSLVPGDPLTVFERLAEIGRALIRLERPDLIADTNQRKRSVASDARPSDRESQASANQHREARDER